MKASWINFLTQIKTQIEYWENENFDNICFRGHSVSSWDLTPSLFVKQKHYLYSNSTLKNIENAIYFDFVTNAGPLLRDNMSSWDILFEMRHHGIPTRLLDWTESFGTALFFALNGVGDTPCIWMLEPFQLNKNRKSFNSDTIPNPLADLDFNYIDGYLEDRKKPYEYPIAIVAPRKSARMFAQKGLFTLQGADARPVNLIPELSKCVLKFDIPLDAIDEAQSFLKLAGINNYSIFPDLDGLAKHLNWFHCVE